MDSVKIEKIASESYHEYGTVSYAEIKQGRLVAENEGVVETVLVTGESVEIKKELGGEVCLAYAASEEIAEAMAESSPEVNPTVVDPTQTVVSNFVARTSTAAYMSLAEAIAAAPAGDTVVVLKDNTIGDIEINKALTLVGRGYKLSGTHTNQGNGAKGSAQTGFDGFTIKSGENPETVVLENFNVESVGNIAVINVPETTGNDSLKLVLRNVSMRKYFAFGVRVTCGEIEIDGCKIDNSLSPRSTTNCVQLSPKDGHSVVAKIKNSSILGALQEDQWTSTGVCVCGHVELAIENSRIYDCFYGLSIWDSGTTIGAKVISLKDTYVEASYPVCADYTWYNKAHDLALTVGSGNHFVSSEEESDAIYVCTTVESEVSISIDKNNCKFDTDYVGSLWEFDSSKPAEEQWIYTEL